MYIAFNTFPVKVEAAIVEEAAAAKGPYLDTT
jgi:hypothetical protein